MDAAVLAKAVGRPVRVQYMRDQGTGWDPKGPASIHKVRAAIDASGIVVAYDFLSKAFSRVDVDTNGSKPYDTLAGQTLGVDLKSGDGFGIPAESTLRQQAHRLGGDPAAARPRLAAAHLASARSGRAANPFRQRIVHGRSGGRARHRPDRIPPALCQGPARHRRDQGGGGKGRLADAAVAAQGPDRRQSLRPRHRLCATQRHARRHDRRSRCRSPKRQDPGAAIHRRPRLRPDHQSGRRAA